MYLLYMYTKLNHRSIVSIGGLDLEEEREREEEGGRGDIRVFKE